jgi:hypothetical protein
MSRVHGGPSSSVDFCAAGAREVEYDEAVLMRCSLGHDEGLSSAPL